MPDYAEDSEITYRITIPAAGRRGFNTFTDGEKELLRPIAETLAMLDGNAFFTMDAGEGEWYEQYLVEAWYLWENNGGMDGWAGEASWAREERIRRSNPALNDMHEQYKIMMRLTDGK
jgi:hypothetical protein